MLKTLKIYSTCSKKCQKKGGAIIGKNAEQIVMDNLENIENWASIGLSQKEIAERLNIGYSTFRELKSTNLALSALFPNSARLKRFPNEKIKKVEKALYDRAIGYEYEQSEFIKVKESGYDERGKKWEKERLEEVKKKVFVPPDVNAAKFYLINRDRRNWKDNPHKVENDKQILHLRKKEAEAKEW